MQLLIRSNDSPCNFRRSTTTRTRCARVSSNAFMAITKIMRHRWGGRGPKPAFSPPRKSNAWLFLVAFVATDPSDRNRITRNAPVYLSLALSGTNLRGSSSRGNSVDWNRC